MVGHEPAERLSRLVSAETEGVDRGAVPSSRDRREVCSTAHLPRCSTVSRRERTGRLPPLWPRPSPHHRRRWCSHPPRHGVHVRRRRCLPPPPVRRRSARPPSPWLSTTLLRASSPDTSPFLLGPARSYYRPRRSTPLGIRTSLSHQRTKS